MASPSVSICIPAYNAAERIGRAIDSVLAQTHEDFEVVVVDDASADATAEVVRGYMDSRISLFVNPRNLGMAGNWNETIRRARAPLVKFLHDDDHLEPHCLEALLPLFERQHVGLAFSRRSIVLEDPGDPLALVWRRDNEILHRGLGALPGTNDGTVLFERYLAAGFPANWIGEPSCVLVRKACLQRVGGFSLRIRQILDLDLWARLMAHYDVGFVDEKLCNYRFGRGATVEIVGSDRHWLDRVWMLQGLRRFPHLDRRYPQLSKLHAADLRLARGRLAADLRSGRFPGRRLRDASGYAHWRARSAMGRPTPLWEEVA